VNKTLSILYGGRLHTREMHPRSSKKIYAVVDTLNQYRSGKCTSVWSTDPATAALDGYESAQRRALYIRSRGGPHRRCSVVAVIGRIGELA